ncbi:bromodomain-containing protein 7 isoform X2 [Anabas testudineus]|uniref:bromodomain-containing protein 7 isoform X2 n=1 Tax=Anabas testudineus TaxID=64144 RepID=UPI000E4615F3|nr:bromodomain-containing protein 7 isoform X2 [Anabas testudineus]
MGKKHKKHKSEKHGYEEYGERPLKLVLKVSGNEVTTGSSSLDTFYDEQPVDYDKPKDKKKKKKKDKERSFGSPEDDKGKKKMTKKKKGQDADGDDDRESRTPIRSELNKLEEKEQTPLQEALNQLIRQLQRKDPSAFFSFPVTDLIAPGYSAIIKRPMDFSTMKDKVKKELYQSLDELKVDFRIMCENAMFYNKPETIYHKAARKLLHSGMKILSQQLGKSEEQGGTSLDQSREGPMITDTSESSQTPSTPRQQDKDSKDEVAKAEKEMEEIRKAIDESGGKLSNRVLQCDLEFARRKSDGSTTLGILNPADLSAGDVGYCPVKLGLMSNRLQSGVNTLQGFREDKRNRTTPVCYMNYGPFTSYAPTYDSSFANISKDDSDLIYSFYGEESSLQGSDSLSEFLAKSDEYVYKLADNLLDAMTNGEHSKSLKEPEPQVEEQAKMKDDKDDMEVAEPEASSCSRLDFLRRCPAGELSGEALHFQQKLDETTKLLRDLQEAQKERLSAKQPPNMICLLAPTAKELELAEKVTGNLTDLAGQVAPCDVCSIYGIRKAMGIAVPPEPPGPFIDLTTVQDTAEPMETLSGCQDAVTLVAV